MYDFNRSIGQPVPAGIVGELGLYLGNGGSPVDSRKTEGTGEEGRGDREETRGEEVLPEGRIMVG